jgi:hypothetical protein
MVNWFADGAGLDLDMRKAVEKAVIFLQIAGRKEG